MGIVEMVAKKGYEAMLERPVVHASREGEHAWEKQSKDARDDWKAVAVEMIAAWLIFTKDR